MSNGNFKLIRNLPLDLQYYFLRGLSADCQLFVAAACREWYTMMRGHIHVSLTDIIRQGYLELLIFILPRIQADERLLMRAICLVCKHNQTDMLEMLRIRYSQITAPKKRYTTHGKRTCPAHNAAIFAIQNKNAKMLQIIGDMFPHVYEDGQCTWLGRVDGAPDPCINYTRTMLYEIINTQAISVLSDVLDKPFVAQYDINDIMKYAREHGKTVSHMYLMDVKAQWKRPWYTYRHGGH